MQVTISTLMKMTKEKTYSEIAKELSRKGYKTVRGYRLTPQAINNAISGRTTIIKN